MQFHAVADIFPMMSPEEYESLKADIKQNGLLQPIWTYEDQIIDGRNRYNACKDLDISPTYKTWDGNGSLVAFVVSLNLQRRHLNSSQKAFVALEVERLLAEEARERQREAGIDNASNLKQYRLNQNFDYSGNAPTTTEREPGDDDELDDDGEFHVPFVDTPKPVVKQPQASEQAAKLTGTNRQYVSDAKSIQKSSPEVAKAVVSGALNIPDAKEVARLPEEERKEVIDNIRQGEKPKDAIKKAKGKVDKNGSSWSEYEIERMNIVMSGGVVYANIRADWQLWEWAMREDVSLNISDTSPFQNPFQCPGDGKEHEVLDHYRQYLVWKPTLTSRLKNLSRTVIGCRCLTRNCHCAILKEHITLKEMS